MICQRGRLLYPTWAAEENPRPAAAIFVFLRSLVTLSKPQSLLAIRFDSRLPLYAAVPSAATYHAYIQYTQ